MPDFGALILRENTNTSGLVATARSATEILAHFETPHLIAGGLAVQEHGYPRLTIDVDIVVPDVLDAVELLTAPWIVHSRETGSMKIACGIVETV